MRNIKNINENWVFVKEKEKSTVNLPHTWNGIDGQDGGNDYYRGKCTYIKEIAKVDMPQGEEIYLQLDGVNSSAFVYFNSKLVCTHHGGYSTFRVKLENIKDNNEIKIEADNSPNDFVYPQQADFTFYGGIYRDVTLIGVEKNHFDLDYYGAPGIQITPIVNGDKADVNVKTYITGGGEVRVTVNGETKTGTEVDFIVDNPHLWNGVADPYLYNAVAELIVDGKVVDRVENRFGIRSFKVDPQKGFILNGKPYPLRGVSRHQDRPGIGNALLPEHHREDIELICEMGANTIRLAHYQHAQYFYDLCDEKGLVVWAEIPYISSHLEKGVENTKTQMTELIAQNYNHPCIVTWGLSNEITMSGASPAVVENHKMLNDLVHSMDKTRPTTEAVVTMCSMDNEYVHISDIVSYNHYFGWYGGNVDMYGPWFDKFHEKYPDKAIGISEYGCEALNWHATDIAQGDYTEEYQAYYHEELIKQIAVRPYLWATHVWNMFDFAADARAEGGENGMNHKGLVTFDRKYKKDSFYAYQAWLSDKPMLHICSKRYIDRVEDKVKIKVYSNQDEVELFANGESVGVQKKGEFPFFTFEVKNEGETVLTAKAGDLTDESKIRKVDSFNEDYRMKEEGAVINWFEINTPVGYYSVNDTIGDIMGSFRGKLAMLKIGAMLLKALKGDSQPSDEPKKKESKGASIMGFKPSKEMLQLGYGFTVKRVISMLGGKFTKEQILKINAILN
ncbi:glycoside hydrolase family 2 protein, partial [uncultured Eubacterium sp.]|uniref:glycoside hydrolase family 2 protein n=1 Tax=uncultured Eubacterium sp. TaxID=165185 RepID=UPI0025FF737D